MKNPLQVPESKTRASNKAAECPYLVDRRCPHAGISSVAGFAPTQMLSGLMKVIEDDFRVRGILHWSAADLDRHALA
jgi:hypothetical protein